MLGGVGSVAFVLSVNVKFLTYSQLRQKAPTVKPHGSEARETATIPFRVGAFCRHRTQSGLHLDTSGLNMEKYAPLKIS